MNHTPVPGAIIGYRANGKPIRLMAGGAPDAFPPGPPVITPGTGGVPSTISMELWLQQPARVQKVLQDLTLSRFVSSFFFSPGPPATGGGVIYDQILGNDLYGTRDVQNIEPGSRFPLIATGDLTPLQARTIKWGGAALLTYEERDRDRRDQLNRKLTKLRNTLVRKVDTVAIATLRAAPILQGVSGGSWASNTYTGVFRDIAAVKTTVDKQDLGYEIDRAAISPNTALNMLTNTPLQNLLPREGMGGNPNPIVEGALTGVAGIRQWFVTNRVGDDEILFASGLDAGSISDEKPLYSRVVDRPEEESVLIMAARLCVPFVTDPKSVFRLTGINGGVN